MFDSFIVTHTAQEATIADDFTKMLHFDEEAEREQAAPGPQLPSNLSKIKSKAYI